MKFELKPPPHALPTTSVPRVMRHVIYALVPAALAHVWFFGWGICINALFATLAALGAEALMLRLRGRPVRPALLDGTATVTAVLLAFAIPPLAPWWVPVIGAVSAIVLAKHLYGGMGSNLFNPAMVGYAVLLISFPVEMTYWLPPRGAELELQSIGAWDSLRFALAGALPQELDIDAVTQATPLDLVREGLTNMQTLAEVQAGPLFGGMGGQGWEWVNSLIAIGGFYLLFRGIIRWHIPVSMLAAMAVAAAVFHTLDASLYASASFHLFSGASLLGAFFIATDPVSAATTNRGRLIYGAGIGILTYAIRTWGGYPDGVAFAVLLMNTTVPLLDRYTRPRIYGRTR